MDARKICVYEREQMVKRKEMEKLFNDLVEAKIEFNKLDATETRGLLNLFDTKKIQLNERKRQQSENV